mgnify:CR=1 FL=1
MKKIPAAQLEIFAKDLLHAMGVRPSDAEILWDSMAYADLRGKTTHGVARLPLYWKNIQAGTIDPRAQPVTVSDKGALAVLDACNGFGQIAAAHAVKLAVQKAKTFGISAVGVRNSNNFGAAGYYGLLAAEQGVASLVMANASPALVAPGASAPVLGTNPLCFAAPGADGADAAGCPPIIFDMASTVAARSKIRLALKNQEAIPQDWAIDAAGNPTSNPKEALAGALLPVGGAKGYGLALMVDYFAGLLTGSAFAGQVKPLGNTGAPSRNGHFFIAVDVSAFYGKDEYQERYNELVEALKASGEEVRLPGERSLGTAAGTGASCSVPGGATEDAEHEIVLSDVQYAELIALRDELEGAPEGALGGSQRSATGNVLHGSVEGALEGDLKTVLKTRSELHGRAL